MNAREARKHITSLKAVCEREEMEEALNTAITALRHEEKMERIADLEATPEKVTLTLKDVLYFNEEVQVFKRLLHHLSDDIVDHIGFMCECEMKERYEARKNEKPAEDIDWEQLEMECEA